MIEFQDNILLQNQQVTIGQSCKPIPGLAALVNLKL